MAAVRRVRRQTTTVSNSRIASGQAAAPAEPRIRPGAPGDAAVLAAFAARSFSDAFGRDNRPEDLAAHLASSYGVPQQSRELADPRYVTLLAEQGTTLAGYAQVRRQAPPPCVTGATPIELYRFYVDGTWHGRGVSQALMEAVRSAAAGMGGETIWLSVWEKNPRARAFYAKCGFQDVGTTDFHVGPDRQTDRVLVASLAGAPEKP